MADHWAKGGSGAVDLGRAVEKACLQKLDFKFLYDLRVDILLFLSSDLHSFSSYPSKKRFVQ